MARVAGNRLTKSARLAAVVLGVSLLHVVTATAQTPASSLLLLIDASGSMGDPVGNGDPQIKIVAAKQAAVAALERAADDGTVEVAVLAFEGDCSNPVPRQTDFTSNFDALQRFIAGLQPGGGTPMAEAMLFANRFMQRNGSAGARDRMIVLLADGENDCGSVGDALAEMQASGVIFRHETVGFGIEADSGAARDLREIAEASGGAFHTAADAGELGELLSQFVDTFSLIDMLGMFGGGAGRTASSGAPGNAPDAASLSPGAADASAGTSQADAAPNAQGRVTSMLGQIQPAEAAEPNEDEDAYIYCSTSAIVAGIGDWYFTGVFAGNYDSRNSYIGDFLDYLETQGHYASGDSWSCFAEDSRAAAQEALAGHIDDIRRMGHPTLPTGWRPGAAFAAAEPFTPRPLQDFSIAVPASPYDVEVCIRDHECEDGDRVRVSINGIELMSEEIVNAWICRNVALGEGRHDIELFAINGTGFKGEDCSHADGNTGEIRVTGEDSQTQSWRHRGGAGSSAGIEVTVR